MLMAMMTGRNPPGGVSLDSLLGGSLITASFANEDFDSSRLFYNI